MGRAVAQAQEQAVIPQTESLELVRCLLRVSIFHVSWMRGMFPDKSFNGVDMRNLDGMHIKMLKPVCEESRRMVEWVEKGVYEAIKKGYAKTLYFGAAEDPEGSNLIEEYVFSFSYGAGGAVVMDNVRITTKGQTKNKQPAKGAGVDSVRYQVCRLMRMLVQVCQTLDKLPDERYLFMKLSYHEHTPEDYEPPYFSAVPDSSAGYFCRKPFTMQVGSVATGHHAVSLKIKSLLDAMVGNDDNVKAGGPEELFEGQESAQVSSSMMEDDEEDEEPTIDPVAGNGKAMYGIQDEGEATSRPVPAPSPAVTKTPAPHKEADVVQEAPKTKTKLRKELSTEAEAKAARTADSDDVTQCPTLPEHATKYEQLKAWCLRLNCSQVDVTDAMSAFMDVSEALLETQFGMLVIEGILQPSKDNKDKFIVVHGTGEVADKTALAASLRPDTISKQLGGLKMQGPDIGLQRDQDVGRAVAMDVDTQNGQAQAAGSAATTSHLAVRHKRTMEMASQPKLHIDASQESAMAGSCRVRKASLTSLPIHQQPQKRVCTRSRLNTSKK